MNNTTHKLKWIAIAFSAMLLLSFSAAELEAQKLDPVLLIHGTASGPEDWNMLPTYLGRRGFIVYTMNFEDWEFVPAALSYKKGIEHASVAIARQLNAIKAETGADQVNIIAHSIAGLAVRAYIAGWGEYLDPQARYSQDIARIIYLNTPHYGFDNWNPTLKHMLRETQWGFFYPANNEEEFFEDISFGSEVMGRLMMDTLRLHPQYDFEEISIGTNTDEFIYPHLSSIVGLYENPLFIPRPDEIKKMKKIENHLILNNYRHASSEFNGNPYFTLLNVDSVEHPTYDIARLFFTGNSNWVNITGNKTDGNLVFITADRSSGFTFRDYNVNRLKLYRVFPKRKTKVRLFYEKDADLLYFQNEGSGTFMLEVKGNPIPSIRFDLNLLGGTTQVLNFSEESLQFDPSYKPEPGDNSYSPGKIPSTMNSYDDLRQFVFAAFPFEVRNYKTKKDLKKLAKDVKALLYATYPHIIKKSNVDKFGISKEVKIDWIDGVEEGILANKLSWVEIKKETGGGGGGGDGGGGQDKSDPGVYPATPPSDVTNVDTLRTFTAWYLKSDAWKNYHEKKIPAAMVRDKLAQMYSNIVRLNDGEAHPGYYRTDDRHRDAIFLLDKGIIIDFVRGSSDPGAIYPSLMWLYQPITPW